MTISVANARTNKRLYDAINDDQKAGDGKVYSETLKGSNSITYFVQAIPGICIIEEKLNCTRAGEIDLIVNGAHLFIAVLYTGESAIKDADANEIRYYQPGIILQQQSAFTRFTQGVHAGQQAHRFYLMLSDAYLSRLSHQEGSNPAFNLIEGQREKLHSSGPRFINQSIRNLLHELSTMNYAAPYNHFYLDMKVKELLFLLRMQENRDAGEEQTGGRIYRKVVMAKGHMLSNFVEPPTIGQLSRIVSLNEFELKMHFKAFFGTTIHAYAVKLRMESAQKMLMEGLPVSEVAALVGYRSVSHFIDVFKKHFGTTPGQAIRNPKLKAVLNN